MRRERTIKCVVVGDSGVGKTHMLLTRQRGEPPAKGETLPAMCEIHTTNVEWRPQYLPTVDRGDSTVVSTHTSRMQPNTASATDPRRPSAPPKQEA